MQTLNKSCKVRQNYATDTPKVRANDKKGGETHLGGQQPTGDGGVEMVYRAVLGVPLCVCVADQSSHVHAHTCKSRTFHEK